MCTIPICEGTEVVFRRPHDGSVDRGVIYFMGVRSPTGISSIVCVRNESGFNERVHLIDILGYKEQDIQTHQ